MRNNNFLAFATISYLISRFSMAGSPGGLIMYIHPLSSGVEYKSNIDNYFYQHYGVDSDKTPSCSVTYGRKTYEIHPAVDVFYLNKRVPEIMESLVQGAINNNDDRRKLRSILYNYRGEKVRFGFDGILFYGESDGVVHFYGLSSFAKKIEVIESSLPVVDIANEERLGLSLCNIFSQLPDPET